METTIVTIIFIAYGALVALNGIIYIVVSFNSPLDSFGWWDKLTIWSIWLWGILIVAHSVYALFGTLGGL